MKRIALLLLLASAILAQTTQSVTLTVSNRAYAVVTVCANALCTGGLGINQFKATVNVNPASSWRMVYEGTTATALFQSNGYTYTVYSLYVDTSKDACVAYAKANGITIPDAVLNPPVAP